MLSSLGFKVGVRIDWKASRVFETELGEGEAMVVREGNAKALPVCPRAGEKNPDRSGVGRLGGQDGLDDIAVVHCLEGEPPLFQRPGATECGSDI